MSSGLEQSAMCPPRLMGVLRHCTGNHSLAVFIIGGTMLFASAPLPFCGVGVAAHRPSRVSAG